jgi:hypothetical protein
MQEIKWRGKVIHIKSEKIRVALIKAQEITFELDRTTDPGVKLPLYKQLTTCHGEALQEISSELKAVCISLNDNTLLLLLLLQLLLLLCTSNQSLHYSMLELGLC